MPNVNDLIRGSIEIGKNLNGVLKWVNDVLVPDRNKEQESDFVLSNSAEDLGELARLIVQRGVITPSYFAYATPVEIIQRFTKDDNDVIVVLQGENRQSHNSEEIFTVPEGDLGWPWVRKIVLIPYDHITVATQNSPQATHSLLSLIDRSASSLIDRSEHQGEALPRWVVGAVFDTDRIPLEGKSVAYRDASGQYGLFEERYGVFGSRSDVDSRLLTAYCELLVEPTRFLGWDEGERAVIFCRDKNDNLYLVRLKLKKSSLYWALRELAKREILFKVNFGGATWWGPPAPIKKLATAARNQQKKHS